MKLVFVAAFAVGLVLVQSCGDDNSPTCTKEVAADKLAAVDKTRLAADIQAIDLYLSTNGISAQSEPNGVRYVVKTPGTGITPCLESSIKVKTTGTLLKTGFEFQPDLEFTTRLSGLILGWQLVLPLIPAGSTLTLYIPSGYGYGVNGGGGGKIPANANLIFEIYMSSVN